MKSLVIILPFLGLVFGNVTWEVTDQMRQLAKKRNTPVDQGCYKDKGGVCVLFTVGSCPSSLNRFTMAGCSTGSLCCYSDHTNQSPVEATKPPATNEACGYSYVEGLGAYRVVGGWNATKGEWPWMVSVQVDQGHWCGGALISDRYVVTAAHCFMRTAEASRVRVVLGEHDREVTESSEQIIDSEQVFVHKSFNTPSKQHDIALIKLKKPAAFNPYTQSICLPKKTDSFERLVCTVAGWGSQNPWYQVFSRFLQEVNVPVKESSDCNAKVSPFYSTNMCAGFDHGTQDSCGGDSGGPLMCRIPGEARWKVAGVVSWGKGCAQADNPGVYTKLSEYLDWMDAIMKNA